MKSIVVHVYIHYGLGVVFGNSRDRRLAISPRSESRNIIENGTLLLPKYNDALYVQDFYIGKK